MGEAAKHRALPQRDRTTGYGRCARQGVRRVCTARGRDAKARTAPRRDGAMGTSRPTAKPHEVCARASRTGDGGTTRRRGGVVKSMFDAKIRF